MKIATTILLATTLGLLGCSKQSDRAAARESSKHPAGRAAASPSMEPALVAISFHADWCGTCKALAPTLRATMVKYEGRPIELLVFDMTTDQTKAASQAKADERGLRTVFDAYAPKTGFVVLVDAASGEVITRLTRAESPDRWSAIVGTALAERGV